MNCASCDYWHRYEIYGEIVEGGHLGECRRHSPMPAPHGINGIPIWPVTAAVAWCGDYERHLTRRLAE